MGAAAADLQGGGLQGGGHEPGEEERQPQPEPAGFTAADVNPFGDLPGLPPADRTCRHEHSEAAPLEGPAPEECPGTGDGQTVPQPAASPPLLPGQQGGPQAAPGAAAAISAAEMARFLLYMEQPAFTSAMEGIQRWDALQAVRTSTCSAIEG